jgi:hypothetical protein
MRFLGCCDGKNGFLKQMEVVDNGVCQNCVVFDRG